MPASIDLIFTKAPSLWTTGFSALKGYSFTFDPQKPFAKISATRNGITPDPKRMKDFAKVCRIDIGSKLPLIYPLTFIYPLVQIMLARKEAPLSLLKTLNTRMRIIQYRPIGLTESFDVFCKLAEHRLVEKGLEVDIHSVVRIAGEMVWESTITFYYRGKFGAPNTTFQPPELEAIPDAPEIARWFLPAGLGFAFAKLSGDGNPIHYWKFYARLSGFQRDFAQPLLVLTETLSYLEKKHLSDKLCLDIAFKGPVYYESNIILKSIENGHAERFDIYGEGNPRPCICGNLKFGKCIS